MKVECIIKNNMENIKIPKPWSAQIEPTFGCCRKCHFCGIQSANLKIGEYKFMSLDLAKKIAIDLNVFLGKKRIEFALSGEPLANPNMTEIIKIFRDNYPKSQLQITTNGDLITKDLVENLFNNGLNMLLVDCYDKNSKSRIQTLLSGLNSDIRIYDFYKDNPKVWSYKGDKQKEIIYMDSIASNDEKDITRRLNNQAGFGKLKSNVVLPLKVSCSNVFRELVVKYDGSVYACCMSGWIPNPEMIVGKFPENSLKEIWEGDKFNSIRKILYNSERYKLNTCAKCDYKGYKNSLALYDFKNVFEIDKQPNTIIYKKSRSLFMD